MIDEDVSRRTIALSMRTGKLTARVLAYALRAAGRKILEKPFFVKFLTYEEYLEGNGFYNHVFASHVKIK